MSHHLVQVAVFMLLEQVQQPLVFCFPFVFWHDLSLQLGYVLDCYIYIQLFEVFPFSSGFCLLISCCIKLQCWIVCFTDLLVLTRKKKKRDLLVLVLSYHGYSCFEEVMNGCASIYIFVGLLVQLKDLVELVLVTLKILYAPLHFKWARSCMDCVHCLYTSFPVANDISLFSFMYYIGLIAALSVLGGTVSETLNCMIGLWGLAIDFLYWS